jgi:transcriptional regulator with XRE-family HTH domain
LDYRLGMDVISSIHPREALKAMLKGGATQVELAEECGCEQATISKILLGQREPKYTLALAIIEAYARRRDSK